MIPPGLKVGATCLLLCLLVVIGYDLFQTARQNALLYRGLRQQLSLRSDPTRRADGTSFVGETFPDFALADLSGRVWRLADITSPMKVIIIFGLNDCGLCLQEYPLWKKIDETYPKNKVVVMGITHSTDRKELISFAEERKLHFPILLDLNDSVRNRVGFRSSPLRILLDAENKIMEVARPDPNLESQKEALMNLASQVSLTPEGSEAGAAFSKSGDNGVRKERR